MRREGSIRWKYSVPRASLKEMSTEAEQNRGALGGPLSPPPPLHATEQIVDVPTANPNDLLDVYPAHSRDHLRDLRDVARLRAILDAVPPPPEIPGVLLLLDRRMRRAHVRPPGVRRSHVAPRTIRLEYHPPQRQAPHGLDVLGRPEGAAVDAYVQPQREELIRHLDGYRRNCARRPGARGRTPRVSRADRRRSRGCAGTGVGPWRARRPAARADPIRCMSAGQNRSLA